MVFLYMISYASDIQHQEGLVTVYMDGISLCITIIVLGPHREKTSGDFENKVVQILKILVKSQLYD